MTVEEFKQIFLRICKDHHVEPQDCVLNGISRSHKKTSKGGGHCLNLSTHSLTVKTCIVLGKCLVSDRAFTEIKLNDCMLPEEGVRALAHGMSQNVACRKLDLKGNNIRGTATEALGRMLKQNKTLISLCLEWNAMGMVDTSFGLFCEGLGSNTRLQVLDLRNNQVNHDGATDLGAALKRNSVLRILVVVLDILDLRWNTVGLIGGRQLVSALDTNKTVVKLELAGNNTPEDILRSLDSAVAHNADRVSLSSEFLTRQQMLSKEVQELQKSKASEMSKMADKMERQEAALRKSSKGALSKISQLQDALEERKQQFNTSAAKLAMAESELALSESKINEIGALLSRAKEETTSMNKQHQSELKREREERAVLEAKLTKEMIELNDKNMQQENQIDELERRVKQQQEQIFELKERLTHTQADYKMKQGQYEDKLQYERQKGKDNLKDLEHTKNKEIERLRREADDLERLHKEKINRLETGRIELEEELSLQKTSVAEERVRSEEHVLHMRQKIKAEQEQKVHGLEEKLRALQATKEEMVSHSAQQSAMVSDLQTKNANLTLDIEACRRKNEDLVQEVSGKNNEVMAEVGKVKLEMNQKIQRLETERQSQSQLYDRVSQLERELSELKTRHSVMAAEKDGEIARLKEKYKVKEGEVRQLREDETQRAAVLQAAITSYISRPATPRD